MRHVVSMAAAVMLAASGPLAAQTASNAEQAQDQESLKVYFEIGSAQVAAGQQDVLDQAARLFREGSPIVMIVAGGADTVGPPDINLDLSLRRAEAVGSGLGGARHPVGTPATPGPRQQRARGRDGGRRG